MENLNMDNLLKIENIKLKDNVKYELKEVCKRYDNYIQELINLEPEKLNAILRYIRYTELEETQLMESVSRDTVRLNILLSDITSIDKISSIFEKNRNLTIEEIDILHSYLIKGTDDDKEENHGYRKKEVIVSGIDYDLRIINGIVTRVPKEGKDIYLPPKSILDYLNNDTITNETDTIFTKPFITHALIAILQPFGNGNTRIARLIQNGKIMEMTNDIYKEKIVFERPILCLSQNYKNTKGDYREKISKIAQAKDENQQNEAWNEWILYNLYMTEEQLNRIEYILENTKKIKR